MKTKFILLSMTPMIVLITIRNVSYIQVFIDISSFYFILILLIISSILIFTLVKFAFVKRGIENSITVLIEENCTDKSFNFLMTYILPIVFIKLNDIGLIFTGGIIIIGFIILLYKTDLYIFNPILTILGYKIYTVSFPEIEKKNSFIVTRKRFKDRLQISTKKINEYTYYAIEVS